MFQNFIKFFDGEFGFTAHTEVIQEQKICINRRVDFRKIPLPGAVDEGVPVELVHAIDEAGVLMHFLRKGLQDALGEKRFSVPAFAEKRKPSGFKFFTGNFPQETLRLGQHQLQLRVPARFELAQGREGLFRSSRRFRARWPFHDLR